jgi:putative membrane protein
MYNGYHFGGMHFLWWIIWMIFIFWIFALPYDVPGQRKKKDSSLDILKKRLADGEITKEDFHEHKSFLEKELSK